MPLVRVNGIDLYYETMGQGEPLLLIMGLGAQLIGWEDGLCAELCARGFQVIRFDNRDVGLSSKLHHLPRTPLRSLVMRSFFGLPVTAPYTLSDMARDAVGVLDALGVAKAHVTGLSMGGMIAQLVAIEHPGRVASLTSIMSHPGDALSRLFKPSVMRLLFAPAPRTRDEVMDRSVAVFRVIGSPGYPFDEERLRRRAALSYDRAFYPRGVVRQIAAISASPSRLRTLRRVRVPTLVIHGAADPLVPVRGGRRTARAIPGAILHVIDGMGHDLPPVLWPEISDRIARNAARSRRHGSARRW